MTEVTFARDTLVTFGAGITALLLVFGTLVYFVIVAPKFFRTWQEMVRVSDEDRRLQLKSIAELTTMTSEVIRANTAAFEHSGKSTDNMAIALELLTAMYERHDLRAQNIQLELSKVSERTFACKSRWEDKR